MDRVSEAVVLLGLLWFYLEDGEQLGAVLLGLLWFYLEDWSTCRSWDRRW